MKTKQTTMPTGVDAYIDRQFIRKNTPAQITPDGRVYRFVDGKKITEEQFNIYYPYIAPLKTHYYKGVAIGSII
jgi:hypothetical protein